MNENAVKSSDMGRRETFARRAGALINPTARWVSSLRDNSTATATRGTIFVDESAFNNLFLLEQCFDVEGNLLARLIEGSRVQVPKRP